MSLPATHGGLGSRGPAGLYPAGASRLERCSQHLGPDGEQIVTSEPPGCEEGLKHRTGRQLSLGRGGERRVSWPACFAAGRRPSLVTARSPQQPCEGLRNQSQLGRGRQPLLSPGSHCELSLRQGSRASAPRAPWTASPGDAQGPELPELQKGDKSGDTRPKASVGAPLAWHERRLLPREKGTAFVENHFKEIQQPRAQLCRFWFGSSQATLGAGGSPGPPLRGWRLRLQPGFPCKESPGPRTDHCEALRRFEPQLFLEGA